MEGDPRPTPRPGAGPADNSTTEARARSEAMFERLYADLRRVAHSQMKFERASGLLQPTALVHEAFLRILSTPETEWESRGHFFAAVAQTMRRILIDEARRRHALKHGGGRRRVGLDAAFSAGAPPTDLIALDEVLDKLERTDPRVFRVVMLRFFVGLRIEQIAEALECSPRTVKRDWESAKEWLKAELAGTDGQTPPTLT